MTSETEEVLRGVIASDPYHGQFTPLLNTIDTIRAELAAVRHDQRVTAGLLAAARDVAHEQTERAERMERVVEAADKVFDARDYNEDLVARSDLMVAITELRALDAAPGDA